MKASNPCTAPQRRLGLASRRSPRRNRRFLPILIRIQIFLENMGAGTTLRFGVRLRKLLLYRELRGIADRLVASHPRLLQCDLNLDVRRSEHKSTGTFS